MFAQARVESKSSDKNSRGKEQESFGTPTLFLTTSRNSNPLLGIEVKRTDQLGSGRDGGIPRYYDKTGNVFLDKEAIIACVKFAIENDLVALEDISPLAEILEAGLRLEKARERSN
jgi:hypothetical protein